MQHLQHTKHPVRGYLTESEYQQMISGKHGNKDYWHKKNAEREKEAQKRKPGLTWRD